MTKNLKLAIALLITMASMNANAQKKATVKTTKPTTEKKDSKPTKQETMDWIAGKMKENLGTQKEFLSYSDGAFSYKLKLGDYDCISTIYLNKITGISSEYSEDFYLKGLGIKYIDFGQEFSFRNITENAISIAGPNYNEYSRPFTFHTDDAMLERLKKAFNTLIEYNSPKKGADEKF